MAPTPTPAPPMPIQAMPAPIYLAATGSMMKLLFRAWFGKTGPSVTRMKGVIEIDAGEDGEDVGLQKGDQEFERGQRDRKGERQHGADPAYESKCAQHSDESGEDLKGDVPGQHVGEQAHAVRERTYEEREHLDKNDRRQDVAGDTFGHEHVEEAQAVLPEPVDENGEEYEQRQCHRDDDVACHCEIVWDEPDQVRNK